MRFRTRPVIEFLCRPEDQGVIAEPVRANKILPAWFRQLPGIDKAHVSATNDGLTVKRCMPFLDAMTTGWILPLAATVRLEISDGGASVTGGWKFDREMVTNHGPGQVAGNPYEPRPPTKFHNYWSIRTAKGWSCLFLPPLNRPDRVVEVFAGVVDTDTYTAPINFPFVATAADGVYTLEKGTPLVQVIPFRRVHTAISASVRAETPNEREERIKIARSTRGRRGLVPPPCPGLPPGIDARGLPVGPPRYASAAPPANPRLVLRMDCGRVAVVHDAVQLRAVEVAGADLPEVPRRDASPWTR